jgi:hypothetical protein
VIRTSFFDEIFTYYIEAVWRTYFCSPCNDGGNNGGRYW